MAKPGSGTPATGVAEVTERSPEESRPRRPAARRDFVNARTRSGRVHTAPRISPRGVNALH
ncbi:hypothetical protein GCM10017776_57610 [Streptomyces griseoluteus]|nr:hypothetical protein GCM10017776_57610 [Streptomyces griseoluteus]